MKFQVIFAILTVSLLVVTTEVYGRKGNKGHKRKHGLSHLPCEMRNCTAKGKSCVEFHPLCLHNNTAITRSKCVETPPKGCEECICVREDGEFSCRKDISEIQIPVCILPSPKLRHHKKSHKNSHSRDDDDDDNDDDDDINNNGRSRTHTGDLGSGDDRDNGKKIRPTPATRPKGAKPSPKPSRKFKPTPRPKGPKPKHGGAES